MKHASVCALIMLCAALLAAPCLSMREEQARRSSWLRQYVGTVTLTAAPSSPSFSPPSVVVATGEGVIAALAPSSGSLLWRQVLSPSTAVLSLAVAPKLVLAVVSEAPHLRAYRPSDGQLLWTRALEGPSPPGTRQAALCGDAQKVAFVQGSRVVLLRASDGQPATAESPSNALLAPLVASARCPSADCPSQLFCGAGNAVLAIVGADEGAVSAVVDLDSGAVQSEAAAGSAPAPDAAAAAVPSGADEAGAAVAFASADAASLCILSATKAGPARCSALSDASAGALTGLAPLPGACRAGALALRAAQGAALAEVAADGTPALLAFVPGAAAAACSSEGGAAFVSLEAGCAEGGAGVQLLDLSNRALAEPRRLAGVAVPQAPTSAPVEVLAAAYADASCLVLSLSDGSLACLNTSLDASLDASLALTWRQDQALASVQAALFVELPASARDAEAAWEAARPAPLARFRAAFLSLKAQLGLAQPAERAALERHAMATGDGLRPVRDAAGFRKAVVVASAAGVVAALHSGDGHVLWSRRLSDAWAGALGAGRAAEADEAGLGPRAGAARLLPWQRGRGSLGHVHVALARLPAGGGAGELLVLDAHTGAEVATHALPAGTDALTPLPGRAAVAEAGGETSEQWVYAASGAAGAPVALFPDTEEARGEWEAQRGGLRWWRLDREAGGPARMRGFGADASGAAGLRWSASLSGRALALAATEGEVAPGVAARVFADGEVRLRHLDPNLVLAVSEGRAPDSLSVVLLDAVSGRAVSSAVLPRARGPCAAMMGGDRALVSYWDTGARRWALASLELLEVAPPSQGVASLALGAKEEDRRWAHRPTAVAVHTSALFSPLPPALLLATRTAGGVTARQALLGSRAGEVYALDWRLLDPRRPLTDKPTAAHAAEGLVPYSPELPLHPSLLVTHGRRVARLRGAALDPTRLESSALLLAWGLDLFAGRLTPSRDFDQVPDEFPHALLVLVVLVMTAASVALKRWADRKALARLWE